ncbi:PREDICTED: uncharacterized protein LOC108558952 isoform X2 [Nicrophorus vespilloides]|uniref:Uncharacterized protein LOC108558952 isoform X2 n=1 Tax=Nicrophorus vespilloides TaxID=110193 RepID=A0ABM1MAE1_NICVS|nr:PREDICTED: uncharacterized protein LOC108558952 isoform X2 [Nicrophorus vespilloides]
MEKGIVNCSLLPLDLKPPGEESFNIETALILLDKCDEAHRYGENNIVCRLKDLQKHLQDIIYVIDQYISFKCSCKNTMTFIGLHSKARNGLANRLPKLRKDVQKLMSMIDKSIESIIKQHNDPKEMNLIMKKYDTLHDLMSVLYENELQYLKFEPNLERINDFLKGKMNIKSKRLTYINEANEYLEGKSDTFMRLTEVRDNEIIEKIFKHKSSSQEVQNLLRNSLKDVLNKKKLSLVDVEETAISDELKKDLRSFYKTVRNLKNGIKYFKNINIRAHLKQSQIYQLHLIKCKLDLHLLKGIAKNDVEL